MSGPKGSATTPQATYNWANWLTGIGGDTITVSNDHWMNANSDSDLLKFNNDIAINTHPNKTRNDTYMTVDEYLEFYQGNPAVRVPHTVAIVSGLFDGLVVPTWVTGVDSSFFPHWAADVGNLEVTEELTKDLESSYKFFKRAGTAVSFWKIFK